MSQKQKMTKAYTLDPSHVATIKNVAMENGGSSDSAALRFIIDEYTRLKTPKTNTVRPTQHPAKQG